MSDFRLSSEYVNFSLSHGTLRLEDLIPVFAHFLDLHSPDSPLRDYIMGVQYYMNPATGSIDTEDDWYAVFRSVSAEEWGGETFEDANLLPVIRDEDGHWIAGVYWEEQAHDDLESLFYALNDIAPIGCSFSAHPGDGSDFGFWLDEDSAVCLYERLESFSPAINFSVMAGEAYVVTDSDTGESAYYIGSVPPETDAFEAVYGYAAIADGAILGVYDTEESALKALVRHFGV